MATLRDFVKWYNNKDVVPTLEAMQKMMEIYQNKSIDMLKLGCTLPNLSNICLPVFRSQQTANSFHLLKLTRIYSRWELDSDSQKFRSRTNRSRTFEHMVMSYLQSQLPECKIES